MTKQLIISLLLLKVIFISDLKSQVSVNFSPSVYGQTLEGLVNAQIINTYSGALMARITVRVSENKNGKVVVISMPTFVLKPGVNQISRAAFGNAKFSFGNNNLGLTANQTGRFLEGEYEYCYEIDISETKASTLPPVYESCFVHELQPRTPMVLINPVDGDFICNKRPQFIWQPPMPLPSNARFKFILVGIREKQDVLEAVTFNPPLVNQNNVGGNNLFYPANAPDLIEGQQYAWQVTVYLSQTIIARSEVWTFIHQCIENKKDSAEDSYRELKEINEGDFYVANKKLLFSIVNPYAGGDLNYDISAANSPEESIKGLPKFKISPGLNKYTIDLSENRFFKMGKEYLLKVALSKNKIFSLRFIYQND